MRVLLDTNIIIHRETSRIVSEEIGKLFGWIDKLGYDKCIHPLTIEEIEKHEDKTVVKTMRVKLESYIELKTLAPITAEIQELLDRDLTDNHRNDSLLVNEVFNDRVDFLITEDKDIHRKAKLLAIEDRIFTINSFLEKATIENPDLVDYKVLAVKKEYFGNIDLNDSFFDSFKEDYSGFETWYNRKSDDPAYICYTGEGLLAFLYLKIEGPREIYSDINPVFEPKKRLKIGTFKTKPNGHKIGERFMKIIFDNALKNKVNEIYVTIFEKRLDQEMLISFLGDWGFEYHGIKSTCDGEEAVYIRRFEPMVDIEDPKKTFPYIDRDSRIFLVPIYPDYHTNLLPDSILNTESPDDFIENEPHRNAIRKVYISRSYERDLRCGDIIIFYRTKQPGKSAYYSSVVTTIGIVEKCITDITDERHFLRLCRGRSVFSNTELLEHWNYFQNNRPFIVNFLYTYSFPKRPNLKKLIELGIIPDTDHVPRGFSEITKEQFNLIKEEAQVDEHIIVN